MLNRIWRRFVSWPVLSVQISVVLLIAASSKGYEIATEALPEDGFLTSRWFLMLGVEWELFLALWLLGGFYRFYPRMTRWTTLLYFFVLFEVAVNGILTGGSSCPCLGKVNMTPWVPAALDLVILLLLALAPDDPALQDFPDRRLWCVLFAGFSVFGFFSLITMRGYTTMGAVPQLRKDPRLYSVVSIEHASPKTEDFLAIGRKAAGVDLTVDERLERSKPDYGSWQVKRIRLWAVMEVLVRRQRIPARWEKVDQGYTMVPAVGFGKSLIFWFGGPAALGLCMMELRWLKSCRNAELVSAIDP